jgi:glucose/arabinose dehydrogenase
VVSAKALLLLSPLLATCSQSADSIAKPDARASVSIAATIVCDPTNGAISLPAGFCATIFADSLGAARHLAVRTNGDVYVAINNGKNGIVGGVIGLRDTNGDGKADQRVKFSDNGGNGLAYREPYLYFAQNDRVLRYQFGGASLGPVKNVSTVISGLPATGDHVSKTIALKDGSLMYLNIGSATNSCQQLNRQAGSLGIDPCPELGTRAGVWTLDPGVLKQKATSSGVRRFATGLRNMVALAVHPSGELYGVQMNRDNLVDNWPALYTAADDARLPSEELLRIQQGADYGWPYCYYDGSLSAKVLAPEYGGDRVATGRCTNARGPLLTLPAHWAPISMTFYRGTAFPARYRYGAFIAFHGDYFWGDRPRTDSPGYNVVFVPFSATGDPLGAAEVFADGFAGPSAVSRATARYRPTGVAEGPDGALYVSDDVGGRVWRIVYTGG